MDEGETKETGEEGLLLLLATEFPSPFSLSLATLCGVDAYSAPLRETLFVSSGSLSLTYTKGPLNFLFFESITKQSFD